MAGETGAAALALYLQERWYAGAALTRRLVGHHHLLANFAASPATRSAWFRRQTATSDASLPQRSSAKSVVSPTPTTQPTALGVGTRIHEGRGYSCLVRRRGGARCSTWTWYGTCGSSSLRWPTASARREMTFRRWPRRTTTYSGGGSWTRYPAACLRRRGSKLALSPPQLRSLSHSCDARLAVGAGSIRPLPEPRNPASYRRDCPPPEARVDLLRHTDGGSAGAAELHRACTDVLSGCISGPPPP
jgi:hypothetical protein